MLPLISVLLHLYVGARLLPAMTDSPFACAVLVLALLVSVWLMPLGVGLRYRLGFKQPPSPTLIWTGWIGMGLFSSLLVLTFLRDCALLLSVGFNALDHGKIPLTAFRDDSAFAVLIVGAIVTAWGFALARRTAPVVPVDVPIANLPAALHGFRIAQLSDLHVGPTIRRDYLQRVITTVNALDVDMVALTGDLVDGSVAELSAHVAPLGDLTSRHGSYFVTGNHEYYSGAQAWITEFRRLGMHTLLNEHVVLTHGPRGKEESAQLVIGGVTDYGAGHYDVAHRSDPQKAMHGAPANAGVRVLLAHQPRSAEAAADAGFDLQLSGHTHGGQFLPWKYFVRLQQPFVAGLDRLRNLWVYTSRGTGYWGPPNRFGAPSEITVIRLVTA
jgi:predicted MPP superfamily phosphohydrolase